MNLLLALKARTQVGILLFLMLAFVALSENRDLRIIMLAPAAVLFTFHTALYGLEYDGWARGGAKPDSKGI